MANQLVTAMRVHQWAKNLLVFLPLLLAKDVEPANFDVSILAFFAFSFVASAIYLMNDLFDLEADRLHPKKRFRPFASGKLSLSAGKVVIPILMGLGALISWQLPWRFSTLLGLYVILNIAYSKYIKHQAIADVITLAGLYSLRIFAGGQAAGVPISAWLLAFSSFFFLSLALIKRSSELIHLFESGGALKARGYIYKDLPLLGALGSASGYMSVIILALYINSSVVRELYINPSILWFCCPLMVYWISRYWLLANRGNMYHDPVAFALRDKVSYGVVFSMMLFWAVARHGPLL